MLTLLTLLCLVTGTLARRQFIVGGTDVDIADFPWQGSYRTSSGFHTCGCIFIGGRWALTAGHCGGSTSHEMEFGSTDRDGGTKFGVAAVTAHPDYGTGPGFEPNDIALVEAVEEISGVNISPGVMASSADNPGGTGWITGWGGTFGGSPAPVTLQGTEIGIITDAECTGVWGDSFQADNMICVWDGESGTVGACNGDSGGPMSVGSTIYGVTSWIASGCLSNYPSVYCRVGAFQSWVCGATSNEAEGC